MLDRFGQKIGEIIPQMKRANFIIEKGEKMYNFAHQ